MGTPYLIGITIAIAALFMTPRGAMAAPADDIRAAVAAGGATSVKSATQKQFSAALASVMAGKSCHKVSAYAAAATKLRPDLAKMIVHLAIAAVTPADGNPEDACVAGIAAAIAGAEPNLSNQIAAWAVADDPAAAGAIAVAVSAVPGSQSASGVSVSTHAGNAGFFAPSGVSSINPSNVTGGTTSPTGP